MGKDLGKEMGQINNLLLAWSVLNSPPNGVDWREIFSFFLVSFFIMRFI